MLCTWCLLPLLLLLLLSALADQQRIPNDNRCIVLLLTRLGLANRLGSLADWYLVALKTNRKLIVSWSPSPELNASFDKLFDVTRLPSNLHVLHYVVDSVDMIVRYATDNNLTYDVVKDSNGWWEGSALDPSKESFLINTPKIVDPDIQVIISKWDGVLSMASTPCQQYLSKRSKFFRSLHPIEWIQDFLTTFIDQHLRSRLVVGVHVRVDDPAFDWDVVPPVGGKDTNAAMGFSSASLSLFEQTMADITNHFSSSGQEVTFFIASNKNNIKEHFHLKFSNTISLSGSTARDSEEGMAFALLEWLILSESEMVINTYGSTFAAEASQVHQVPLIGVWGDNLIHYNDARLPFCGHMQYIKDLSIKGSYMVFNEGTYDRREVQSRQIAFTQCHLMEGWGVTGTYCSSQADT